MDRIDLHAHTTASDGSLAAGALVALAREAGLGLLAVTDHDTTAAGEEASRAGRSLGVEVLVGVEVTARFPGRAMHLLGYGFEPREPRLVEMLAEIVRGREARNPRILDRLAALGVPVTMDEVRAQAGGWVIARPHIAAALVARGHVPDAKTAFALYLRDGGPAFVPAESVEPEEAVATLRAAGGVAVLAHPRQLRVDSAQGYEALFRRLAAAGLAGVEVDHPSHRPDDRALYARLCGALGLVASGGSDFHGAAKPDVRLGTGDGTIALRRDTWDALRARCTGPAR